MERTGLSTQELWDLLKQLKIADRSQLEAISFMADEGMAAIRKAEDDEINERYEAINREFGRV